jgi:anti-anti-sigma factor
MIIDATTEGKWKLITVSGRFDAQNSARVEEVLLAQLALENIFIAVDLSGVNYMSSAGLRVLLSAYKKAKINGGSLILLKPGDNITEILNLSGFNKIFFVVNSIEGLLNL